MKFHPSPNLLTIMESVVLCQMCFLHLLRGEVASGHCKDTQDWLGVVRCKETGTCHTEPHATASRSGKV